MNRTLTIAVLSSFSSGVISAQSSPSMNIPTIARTANASIVSIVVSDKDGKPLGQGSGFVVSTEGLIVTNYHVIAEGVSAVAKFPDGAFYLIDGVLTSDKVRDVAILKAQGHSFRPLKLGNSDRVQVGEKVVAIGSPRGLESTVSDGIVSGVRSVKEEGGKYLQITAPISPGSSGGPLFNMFGEVVGITTMYLKDGENLNFAIPINDAKPLLRSTSFKPQRLPNERASEKTEQRDHDERATSAESREYEYSGPMPVGSRSGARGFFDQDYHAGIFNPENFGTAPDGSKISLGRMSNADYVCFSDDARSDEFFTFQTWAYDKEYDESWHLLDNVSDREEFVKRQIKQKEIQRGITQDAPYVNFITGGMSSRSSVDAFFLNGGRLLKKDVYSKGVKVDTFEYHWGGTSWFFHDLQFLVGLGATPPRNPDMPVSSPRARYLSIQFLKRDDFWVDHVVLRYVESGADHHDLASGYCESVVYR